MFIDESLEAIEKMNSTRHKSRGGEAHKDRVFTEDSVLGNSNLFNGETSLGERLDLAKKYKKEAIDAMNFEKPSATYSNTKDIFDNMNLKFEQIRKEIQVVGLLKNFYSQFYRFEDITVLQSILQAETVEQINNIMDKIRSKNITDCKQSCKKETDSVEKYNKEGVKLNKDKPQISLLFTQFPKALEAIAKCSEYGHEKYKDTDQDYLNYQRVEGGSKTYADAGLRHRLYQKGTTDIESQLPHAYHVAWNALAELELLLKGK
jgi:hypothetical protein